MKVHDDLSPVLRRHVSLELLLAVGARGARHALRERPEIQAHIQALKEQRR